MAFNINEFSAQLDQKGVAKPSLFEVLVGRAGGSQTNEERDMVCRATAINFPSRQVLVAENFVYGVPSPVAFGSATNGYMNITFISSEYYDERAYFENWIDDIVGTYRKTKVATNMYDISYPKDYYGTVTIYTYTDVGENSLLLTLQDCFPVDVRTQDLNWGDPGVSYTQVTLAYRYTTEYEE